MGRTGRFRVVISVAAPAVAVETATAIIEVWVDGGANKTGFALKTYLVTSGGLSINSVSTVRGSPLP